jgi:hypothetical protein
VSDLGDRDVVRVDLSTVTSITDVIGAVLLTRDLVLIRADDVNYAPAQNARIDLGEVERIGRPGDRFREIDDHALVLWYDDPQVLLVEQDDDGLWIIRPK